MRVKKDTKSSQVPHLVESDSCTTLLCRDYEVSDDKIGEDENDVSYSEDIVDFC